MLVPNELHEWDLGIWRQILIHLLRLLNTLGAAQVNEFDARYAHRLFVCLSLMSYCSFRKISTFGRDTIRKFDDNVLALKKMAARNFEDILQVWCRYACDVTSD